MTSRFNEIIFVHEGKAHYPDITAYRRYFEGRYTVREAHPNALAEQDLSHAVLWYMMGFYPRKIPAGLIIHDYRSLSVGCGRSLKDTLKRYGNHKPDIRIFLNPAVQQALGFKDAIPQLLLDMGVPGSITTYRKKPKKFRYDFCYIGAISEERESTPMLEAFLTAYGDSRSFLMIGAVADGIDERFAQHPNIIFAGKKPQEEVFALLQEAEYAVCFLPNRTPYCFQTPTKLLEYAALGKKILVNVCPSIQQTAAHYSIHTYTCKDNQFPAEATLKTLKSNRDCKAENFFWPRIIKQSGIEQYL